MPDKYDQLVNGTPVLFNRRRYGRTTYTWVLVWVNNEWKSCGDPWPSIKVKRTELEAAVAQMKGAA